MLAVTTFHPSGYEQYGKRCLETLKAHFPGKIVAYYEAKPDIEGIDLRDFFSIRDFNRFLDRVKRHPGSDGWNHNQYDFRFDAQKFCRKTFAQDAVFDEDTEVFWFDADCVIREDLTEEFLRSLIEGVPFCYLGRSNALGLTTYTETGFLGFNTKHERFAEFRAKYLPYFTTGRIFGQLKGWHDCIAFDHARQGIVGNNLTPKGSGMDNVMEQSVLAPFMSHLKGARKFAGDIRPESVSG